MTAPGSFKTKLVAAFTGLIAVIVLLSAGAVFGLNRVHDLAERSRYAHQVLATFLDLSNNTYQLFKQLSDAVLIGDLDRQEGENALLQAIKADIVEARRLIAEEVRLYGGAEDETSELELLSRIESQVGVIQREHAEIMSLIGAVERRELRARLVMLLERRIDREFSALINEAIAEETREVSITDARLESASRTTRRFSSAIAALSLPLAAFVLYHLYRSFWRSLDALADGAGSYARGEFDHHIPQTLGSEFETIRLRLIDMARDLDASRRVIEASNASLEETVIDRTAALAEAKARLEESDSARRRFFADISHELRTPLTVIRGEAEIALRGAVKSTEEYRSSLKRIVDQTAQTTRLVEDLLFIARADSGEPRMEMRSVAVWALVSDVVKNFEAAGAEKSLTIHADCDLPEAVVLGDRGRLRQVFSILLDNAVRYSREFGEISVKVGGTNGDVLISVEDDGIGIPDDEIDRVFERFYRGGNAQQNAGGAGLGLPVAKAITEAHNGHIRLASSPKGGVAAIIRLPIETKLKAIS